MEIKLAENIKRMRKERSLTQEAVANALGVTVGAVYKWEADLTSPELSMLVRIADLFDTSVDTLLGYEMAEKRKGTITDYIYSLVGKKERAAIEEAEKALIRYPNDYNVILAAANAFSAFGTEDRDKAKLKRAIELYEKALRIVPFDVDPRYGKLTIIGNIAFLYFMIDNKDKALTMMKENNEAGVFNSKIGWLSAMKGDTGDDCYYQLTYSFSQQCFELINIAAGILIYYKNTGDMAGAKTITRWTIEYMDNIRRNSDPCFFDKIKCSFLTAESYAYYKTGDKEHAGDLLSEALELAQFFDSSEENSMNVIRLFDFPTEVGSFSLLGETGMGSITTTLEMIDDKKFNALWNKINR